MPPRGWLLGALGAVSAALAARVLLPVPSAGSAFLLALASLGFGFGALSDRRTRRLALPGLLLPIVWFFLAPPAPAVILVVVDCLGADRFSPTTMPRTWALAQEGWRFDYALAQSSWTRSAVASILTGRWPNEHRLYRLKPTPDRLPDTVPTLAEAFAAHGWATAAFAEQAQLDPAFGLARGFATYTFRAGPAPDLDRKFALWNTVLRHVPRFAYLHYLDIHKPYGTAPELGLTDDASWGPFMTAVNKGDRILSSNEWAHLEALHVGEIHTLDTELGGLWDRLRADGTLDESWVVITADHGEAFGQHDWFTHGGPPHAELVQVPLVIRPPGGREVTVLPGHPRQVDLAPTLLGFAGFPPVGSGVDLLRGAPPDVSFAEYFGEADRLLAVRSANWSLLRGPGGDRLYDLEADPHETTPVEDPEVAAALGALADGYLAGGTPSTDAPTPEAGTMEGLRALGYLE